MFCGVQFQETTINDTTGLELAATMISATNINQALRLAPGLLFCSEPVVCALTFSVAFPTESFMSRWTAGVSLCSVVFLLAGAFQYMTICSARTALRTKPAMKL
jgi:hypothetical protein